MKRTVRWRRLGVVLSVAWALGAWFYQSTNDLRAAQNMMELSLSACLAVQTNKFDDCFRKASEVRLQWLDGTWINAVLLGLLPLPFAWGAVYGVRGIFRWITAPEKESTSV